MKHYIAWTLKQLGRSELPRRVGTAPYTSRNRGLQVHTRVNDGAMGTQLQGLRPLQKSNQPVATNIRQRRSGVTLRQDTARVASDQIHYGRTVFPPSRRRCNAGQQHLNQAVVVSVQRTGRGQCAIEDGANNSVSEAAHIDIGAQPTCLDSRVHAA